MPTTTPKKTARPSSMVALWQTLRTRHHCGRGLLVLILTLLSLSLLAGANLTPESRVYVAGQVADSDVIADRDILVEDVQASKARQRQVLMLQPSVYDLSMQPYEMFQNRILGILHHLNVMADHKGLQSVKPVPEEAAPAAPEPAGTAPTVGQAGEVPVTPAPTAPAAQRPLPRSDEDLPDLPRGEASVRRLMEELTPRVAEEVLPQLALPEVQQYLLKTLMPLIRDRLAEGLVGDIRSARAGRAGVVIRNLDNGSELLRPEVTTLPDVQSFLAEISSLLRQEDSLNAHSRRAINILLSATVPASLTLNRETTQRRGEAVVANVEPVFYQIQKGELVVRKGDRVSREQQLKLQTLYKSAADPVRWGVVLGAFLFSLILSIGFFVAPSGKPGTPLRCKDMLLISLVLFLFSVGAKGAFCLATRFDSLTLMANYAVAFPIAGGVGLVAMVFAARRYCTMSLLLCFFAMLMFQADYTFFLYHFLGGMLATWLVTNAQTRQDVVWSIIPLTVGQALIWLGMALLAQISPNEFPVQLGAVAINSLLSLILLFAVSPVLELAFGYSTRFRLMELMSLEHPLMQELMVTIPGTYHHSLVVANMVEAGAKAIGANSLLCKVAALYHDAGKLSYPEYFIENQFGGPNKHDKLAPSMSALIITSHVKKGTELAERYKLGQEIIDIIRQHHGTRVIRYFYQKAINMGERPRESDFSYPGPRPQTKEAAILMLADSVEASSRTLTDPTPARIRTHIDTIIKGIFSEGQLDESELTFKDLHYLSENFQRILTGIFHQRIAYPPAKNEGKQEGKALEAKNADARPAENKAEAKGHESVPTVKEAEEKTENSHSGHHHGRVHDAAAVEAAEKLEAEQLARTEQAGRE
ncbi:HD family phosphohydrolase [Desulfovibrio sp.]